MRENQFNKMAMEVFTKLKGYYYETTDQGIFNIIFDQFPEKLLDLPQQYNWLRGSCRDLTKYDADIMTPISIIHGTSKVFQGSKKKTVSQKFQDFMTQLSINIDIAMPKFKGFKPRTTVIYPIIFQTFEEADLTEIMKGSQNISQIFQEKLDNGLKMYFDPCQIVLPQLIYRFKVLSNLSVF